MKLFPAFVCFWLILLAPVGVFAQETIVRCEIFTGNPYKAEFSRAEETGDPITADGGALRSAVKTKVEGYYDQCTTLTTLEGWKSAGPFTVEGMGTAGTSLSGLVPQAVNIQNLTDNAQFQIYVTDIEAHRGQTFTLQKKAGSTNYIKVSGPGYLDTCQSKQRQYNDFLAREQAGLKDGDPKKMTPEQTKAALIKQLKPELIAMCKTENKGKTGYGQISTLFGRTETDASTAVGGGQMTISCEHLFEIYGYANGEMCVDGLAHQTFSTGIITLGAGGGGVAGIIQRVMGIMAGTIGSVAMLVMVIGGFMMITAGGNEDMVTRGKQAFTYGIIGIVAVFSSYLIVVFVQSLFFAI